MDVYLPADFYRLRDDLSDWRDVSSAAVATDKSDEQRSTPPATHANACADPLWRVF